MHGKILLAGGNAGKICQLIEVNFITVTAQIQAGHEYHWTAQ